MGALSAWGRSITVERRPARANDLARSGGRSAAWLLISGDDLHTNPRKVYPRSRAGSGAASRAGVGAVRCPVSHARSGPRTRGAMSACSPGRRARDGPSCRADDSGWVRGVTIRCRQAMARWRARVASSPRSWPCDRLRRRSRTTPGALLGLSVFSATLRRTCSAENQH